MSTWPKYKRSRIPVLLLLLADFAVVFGLAEVIFAVGVTGSTGRPSGLAGHFMAVALAVVSQLSLGAFGLYRFQERGYATEIFTRVVVAGLFVAAMTAAVAAIAALPLVDIRAALAAFATAVLLIFAVRLAFVRVVESKLFRQRTLVLGAGQQAAAITRLRRSADRRGFDLVGFIPAGGPTAIDPVAPILDDGRSVAEIASQSGADEVVVAMDERRGNLPEWELLQCKQLGIGVVDLMEFLERETLKIHIDMTYPGWLIFSPGFRQSGLQRFSKRLFDIAGSLVLLVVTAPLAAGAALAIKLADGLRAPIIYRQERIGLFGHPFILWKFRSMRTGSAGDSDPDGWTTARDDRVTAVGRVLRKFRIDELPQLVNVLLGSMSLVGPRPERPRLVDDLGRSVPFYLERHMAKPGITGWAQVNYTYGASQKDAIEKLRYDIYYLKNRNLLFDIAIILRTIEVVLWGKGAR